jgi:hypothetical protein
MGSLSIPVLFLFFLASCSEDIKAKTDFIIADGQMPCITNDNNNIIHLAYGSGDSILYRYSTNNGASFSDPQVVSVISHVYTFATRGPQIAANKKGLLITACTADGNIYSFYKHKTGSWIPGAKVNDADTVAKEGLMGLSADGENAFAVWLDLRGNQKNKIYGAASTDGGETWTANKMIYTSPDTSVCECCKPSVAMKGENIYVMFRNQLQGNRDLYLARSEDGGENFDHARQIGNGHWKLDGCPMDGGNLVVNEQGVVQTVWRRESKIYAAIPGMSEKEIGEGKGCTMTTHDGKNVYAWTEKGKVVLKKPDGEKLTIGDGGQPSLISLDQQHVLCIWENEKQIHGSIVEIVN